MSNQSFTINQASEKLNVSTRTIRRYIKAGKLRAELVNGPFGEEYRIRELPDDLKKIEGLDSTGQTALDSHDPTAGASGDMMAVFRELQEKNLALAAQLGAATERVRHLEGQLKQLTDGKPPKTPWWQKWYADISSRFNKKSAGDEGVEL
ncbi:MAG: helix-turn-helix domain-containing protein [Dehalococcoidia bacterium]|nr:MAG: helix-turn-helix domain-containing protein [Dehalococcoidia bacterium]